MAEIGSGNGSDYPSSLDTNTSIEVNSPNAGKTKARAEVVNDLGSAIIAIETELGTAPSGSLSDVRTYLQTEHNSDGTHDGSLVGTLAGAQTFTGQKTFSGGVLWSKGADIASASALTLGSDGNYFDVTGTTDITSINAVGVGFLAMLHFDDALTLTHDGTSLVLPGGADIITKAGDEVVFYEYSAGNWRLINFLGKLDTLGPYVSETEYNVTSTTFVEQAKFTLYIPTGGITLGFAVYSYISTDGTGSSDVRITEPTAGNSTTLSNTSTSYSLVSEGTLDISGITNGWHTFGIDLKHTQTTGTTWTAYLKGVAVRLT